jgi:hypothetical protein
MPDSGGSTEHRLGSQSETPFTQSPIDALAHRATHEQHEDLAPAPVAGV